MQVIATAGHVDHGKSTLVRALTGMEPDRFAEEQRRGMTIDLGFAWTDLGAAGTVAFVDVPGHERFVTTMLAGVGPVPAVLLVVAADEGWMPQSAEHLDALVALGVRDGLLVITRSDLMEPDLALDDARTHLAGTPLADIPDVAVSALTGAGTDALRTALGALAARLPAPDDDADVRLWVDRAFTVRGAGTVVTGTLPGGCLRAGDELELAGEEGVRRVTVRGLQSLGAPVGEARGVSRVAVNLRGVPREAVTRGDALLARGAWLPVTTLDVRLHPTRDGTDDDLPRELVLHIGSAAVAARVRPLGADTVRLRLRHPLPLRVGDRAVLRDPGRRRVRAGITVLDVRPPELRRRGAAAARAAELSTMGAVPDPAAELRRRGVVRSADLAAMGVPVAGLGPAAGGWLVDPEHAAAAARALATAVDAHDRADPLDPGLPTEAARRAAGLPDARLLDAVLAAAPGLAHRDGRVARPRAGALAPALVTALERLRADLADAPFAAPDAARLAELGLGPRELAALVRAGELLRVADGVVLLAGADDRAVEALSELPGEFTASQARQALGTSRRVVVPLLELLARAGRTVRGDDGAHRLRAPGGIAPPGALP
ncbi:selenocysteine-specific translation elongation factor [Pseudonocardia broussonetiae]|uniref:Selenocysteine-specific translation elongation factor n=1 Tax=Pseudonocardia broussonetiae TaxID=2736640 RepID=A0A6M6JE00_9PSEU|nr:selenocysteine-specific translation elongation factor [Pseudonocardia broussonetiae]QJY44701.1 selenocysteine-specific translation elongation factor [Pseudonocardia broussonetiae]